LQVRILLGSPNSIYINNLNATFPVSSPVPIGFRSPRTVKAFSLMGLSGIALLSGFFALIVAGLIDDLQYGLLTFVGMSVAQLALSWVKNRKRPE
jgi:hypothetical protein